MTFVGPLIIFLLLVPLAVTVLHQARRTPGAPEFWAGIYFLGAATGMPLRLIGASFLGKDLALAEAINGVGHLGLLGASIGLTVFTWRVFHQGSQTVRTVAFALMAAQVMTTAITLFGGFLTSEDSLSVIATNGMRVVPSWWACFESLRYWRNMRRRNSIGLADPIVTNRFALWAIWTGAFATLPTLALILRVVVPLWLGDTQQGPGEQLAVLTSLLSVLRIAMLMTGIVGAVALVLSFFPPQRYLDRLQRGGSGAESA